jgi:hypothetical protein
LRHVFLLRGLAVRAGGSEKSKTPGVSGGGFGLVRVFAFSASANAEPPPKGGANGGGGRDALTWRASMIELALRVNGQRAGAIPAIQNCCGDGVSRLRNRIDPAQFVNTARWYHGLVATPRAADL